MSEVNSKNICKKVLIDVGHPAHVHLFKNFAKKLIAYNYGVLFVVRVKESETLLLEQEKLPYRIFGRNKTGLISKAIGLFSKNIRLLRIILSFKPDIIFSHGSFYSSQVGWLLNVPSVVLEDTGNAEQTFLYKYFASLILSPISLGKRISSKQVFYKGFHEQAYIQNAEPYQQKRELVSKKILLRLVTWNASHDIQKDRLSKNDLIKLEKYLSEKGDLIVSSEKKSSGHSGPEMESSFEQFHTLMKEFRLIISEGSTTAIEGCLAGIPTIYCGIQNLSITKYLESKHLLICAQNLDDIKRAIDQIEQGNLYNEFQKNLKAELNGSINIIDLLIYIVNKHPISLNKLKGFKDVIHNKNFKFN